MPHNSHETKEQECLERLLLFVNVVSLDCQHLKKCTENCHCLLFNKVKISFMFLIKTASLANQSLLSF